MEEDIVWRALSDYSRRRIIELLANKDMTPSELGTHFDFSAPALSGHLRILRDNKLVLVHKEGSNTIYSFNASSLIPTIQFFNNILGKKKFYEMFNSHIAPLRESVENRSSRRRRE